MVGAFIALFRTLPSRYYIKLLQSFQLLSRSVLKPHKHHKMLLLIALFSTSAKLGLSLV